MTGRLTLMIGAGLVAVAVAATVAATRIAYQRGVQDTVIEFQQADREGASNVRQTSERVLRDLGNVDDPLRVLCDTGGLRDAECDDDGTERDAADGQR